MTSTMEVSAKAIFGVNAGKRCVAMSLTAIIYNQIQDNSTLNNYTLITLL